MIEEIKQNIVNGHNYSRLIDYIETLEHAYDKRVKLLNQLEEENKQLKRQLSLLCPIADMSVIESLLIEKEAYMYEIQELNEFLKIERIANQYKDLEFCLFKRCVRKFVNKEQYKNICDLYNQAVDKFRKGMNYSDVKGFIDSK